MSVRTVRVRKAGRWTWRYLCSSGHSHVKRERAETCERKTKEGR